MRSLIVLVLLALLGGCGDFDTETMFNLHVVSPAAIEIQKLRGGKVSCLHCPMYFAFEGNQMLIQRIILAHRLQEVTTLSEDIRQVEELVKREAPWWEMPNPAGQDKVYWIQYEPKHAGYDMAFRLLMVRGNRLFFITSGFFNRADYEDAHA